MTPGQPDNGVFPEAKSPGLVRGWCPGALRPMASGDGLIVRVTPPLGQLDGWQANGIAELSRRQGNGRIDLTARANLQIRGVADRDLAAVQAGLDALGLLAPDPATEARRSVMVQPFWTQGDDTHRIAVALWKALGAGPDLPGKFGFAVDTGEAPCLVTASADIRIERAARGLVVRADGAACGRATTVEAAAETALDLARWFLRAAPAGTTRMRALAAASPPPEHDTAPLSPVAPPPPGPDRPAAAFGQIGADDFAALAAAAPLRMTPWRLVACSRSAPVRPGLLTDPDDPRRAVTACTGAPGCAQSAGETRALAARLAGRWPGHLHVSGCAKGCAHPGPAPVTLVARGGGRYDVVRHGTARDLPAHAGLTADELERLAP